jgi:hypothetical protein
MLGNSNRGGFIGYGSNYNRLKDCHDSPDYDIAFIINPVWRLIGLC